jgi:hypothetical protein
MVVEISCTDRFWTSHVCQISSGLQDAFRILLGSDATKRGSRMPNAELPFHHTSLEERCKSMMEAIYKISMRPSLLDIPPEVWNLILSHLETDGDGSFPSLSSSWERCQNLMLTCKAMYKLLYGKIFEEISIHVVCSDFRDRWNEFCKQLSEPENASLVVRLELKECRHTGCDQPPKEFFNLYPALPKMEHLREIRFVALELNRGPFY